MVVYVIVGAIGPAGRGNDLPWFLQIFRYLSPIKPSCEALLISELRDWKTIKAEKSLGTVLKFVFKKKGNDDDDTNPILESLGIGQDVSVLSSMKALVKMILGHSAVALLGLILNSNDG